MRSRAGGGALAPGVLILGVLILGAAAARADPDPQPTAAGPQADASGPAVEAGQGAAPQLRPLCTDRPTKSNGACTVDAGHFQIESDLFNATTQRSGAVTTDTYLFTSPTLKYGLTDAIDVQANIAPDVEVRTRTAGATSRLHGVGDLYLRAKLNLVGGDGGDFAATLFPYLKAPTARAGVGDGAWEGGLLAPLVIKLNDAFSLTFNPELDVTGDMAGGGHHLGTAQLIDLGWQPTKTLTLFGEVWADVDFDPQRTTRQYSADAAIAWQLPHDLQLDAGVNFGLNRETPGVQSYFGVSQRF